MLVKMFSDKMEIHNYLVELLVLSRNAISWNRDFEFFGRFGDLEGVPQ